MSISFNKIPNNIRTPFMFTEFDNTNAIRGAQSQPFKAVIIGQKLAAGTKGENDFSRVTSAKQAEIFYGKGSMLHEMFEAYFKNNQFTEVYGLALVDLLAGVEASGSIKFAGAPTEAGVAVYRIHGYKVSVGVLAIDTPAALATKLKNAIDLVVPSAIATIDGVDTTKVLIKYVHKGLVGNFLDIRQGYYSDEKGLPSGLTSVIVPMAGGAGNPEIEVPLATLPAEHLNVFALPYTDLTNLMAMDAFLEERWGPTKQIDGMAFAAAKLGHADLGMLGKSINTKNISTMECHGSMSGPHLWSAAVAGIIGFEMSKDAAKPLQTVTIKGVYAEESKDSFNMQERNLLLFDGISTHLRSANGDAVIEAMITHYRLNAMGAADVSYLYVETIFQLSYLRYDWNNYIMRKYPRHKLASNSMLIAPGQEIMTPNLYKAEMVNKYKEWMERGYVEDMETFKAGIIVERNTENLNRLDAIMTPDLMNQFRVCATKISFYL